MSRLASLCLLVLALFAPPTVPAEEEQPVALLHRVFLDDGALLAGTLHEWREAVDILARLGFDCIGRRGDGPAPDVAAYLEEKQLSVCPLMPLSAHASGTKPGAPIEANGRQLLGPEVRPSLIAGLISPTAEDAVVWADDGNGAISSWPPDAGLFRGILLNAGSPSDGPVVNPYPARLGASISAAAERGLAGEAWIAAPSFWPFLLNLEAASSALDDPSGFDPDVFYRSWVERRYGPGTVTGTVTTLKLLHAAREQEPGFVEAGRQSAAIIERLVKGGELTSPARPASKSMEYLRRAVGLARSNAAKTAAGRAERFEQEIVVPVSLYAASIELLDALARLESAHRVARHVPDAEPSRQRVKQASDRAMERAHDLARWMERAGPAYRADVPIASIIKALDCQITASTFDKASPAADHCR